MQAVWDGNLNLESYRPFQPRTRRKPGRGLLWLKTTSPRRSSFDKNSSIRMPSCFARLGRWNASLSKSRRSRDVQASSRGKEEVRRVSDSAATIGAHGAERHGRNHAATVSIRVGSLSSARELFTRFETGRITIMPSAAGFNISVPALPESHGSN